MNPTPPHTLTADDINPNNLAALLTELLICLYVKTYDTSLDDAYES